MNYNFQFHDGYVSDIERVQNDALQKILVAINEAKTNSEDPDNFAEIWKKFHVTRAGIILPDESYITKGELKQVLDLKGDIKKNTNTGCWCNR